jgi:tellurite resistance protein
MSINYYSVSQQKHKIISSLSFHHTLSKYKQNDYTTECKLKRKTQQNHKKTGKREMLKERSKERKTEKTATKVIK